MLAILKRLRANTMGVVLNEMDNSNRGYYYYGDYRKGYPHSTEQNS